MRGRTRIVDIYGEPAPYVHAALRLDEWNGVPHLAGRRCPSRQEKATLVIQWVTEHLEAWMRQERRQARATKRRQRERAAT
jgi:hypothetical protein